MNTYSLCKLGKAPFYSSTETSIIPINDDKVLLIPSTGALFDTPVSIRETKSTYLFSPYDYNAEQIKLSFADQYDYLTDDENLFSENQTIESDIEQKEEFEVDKDFIHELLDSTSDSYPFEEFITAITTLLEEFPTVWTSSEKARETTPDDIILILENLVRKNIHLEEALQEMSNFNSDEMNALILSEDKIAVYAKYVGLNLDSD